MDNFGILRLLSAISGAIQNSKKDDGGEKPAPLPPEKQKKDDVEKEKKTPLLSGILKTSASHDEFISRVYKGNKKTP